MRRIVLISVVLGLVLFAAALGYLLGRQALVAPLGEYAELRPEANSSHTIRPVDWKLARGLALRVANTFVAQRGEPGAGEIVFFVKPKPYSSFLCRVDAFTFAPKVVRGRANKGEYWADDLTIGTLYALWRLPDEPEHGRTRGRECTAFRDFDRLIVADGVEDALAIERALTHLSRASAEARKGTVSFDVKCEDSRAVARKPCDGMSLLKTFDPLAVGAVQSTRHGDNEKTVYEDSVYMRTGGMRGCGAVETLSFQVRTTGPYIGGNELLSIKAFRSTIC